MGRAKLAMEYIKKDKARTTTFEKRKKGLKKKADELSILCDVPVCVIIYPGPNSEPETYPTNQAKVRNVIDRYVSIPKEENAKRSLGLQEALLGKKHKLEHQQQQQPCKVQKKTTVNNVVNYTNYPSWVPDLDKFSKEELVKLGSDLDYKLNAVEKRIGSLKGSFGIYNGNGNAINSVNGGDVQIDHGMQMQWPLFYDPMTGGASSSGVGGSFPLMGPTYYNEQVQVGPSHENSGFDGGFVAAAQPLTAFYGGGVRFDPRQMGGGGNLGMKWFEL